MMSGMANAPPCLDIAADMAACHGTSGLDSAVYVSALDRTASIDTADSAVDRDRARCLKALQVTFDFNANHARQALRLHNTVNHHLVVHDGHGIAAILPSVDDNTSASN